MKNVEKYSLKNCIFMDFDDFKELVLKVTDGLKSVLYELDGLTYPDTDKATQIDNYWNEYITETLSRYFDVEVTSIHADDGEYIGVWICYKE